VLDRKKEKGKMSDAENDHGGEKYLDTLYPELRDVAYRAPEGERASEDGSCDEFEDDGQGDESLEEEIDDQSKGDGSGDESEKDGSGDESKEEENGDESLEEEDGDESEGDGGGDESEKDGSGDGSEDASWPPAKRSKLDVDKTAKCKLRVV
jgi:hypothetical protein